MYAVDAGNDRIQKFNSSGTFLTTWGSPGSGDGQFIDPGGIATDPSGDVYVVDSTLERLQKFTSTGSFITKLGGQSWGCTGFCELVGVATDSSGAVYTIQQGAYGVPFSRNIKKFSSSLSGITQWGEDQVGYPGGIATDPFGAVYVVNNSGNGIQKFTPRQAPQQPPADRDGDGVPDGQDACPDEPGTGADGCPPTPDPPTAEFAIAPSPSQAGQAVTFDWTGTCPAAPCTFTWVDEGPDGDGGSSSPLGSGDPHTFTFSGAGTKFIELTVSDSLGRSVVSPIRQHEVTAATPPPGELRWSTDTDRAPSQPLDGVTLPSSAVCVFLDNDPAKQGPVRFHLDEPPDATSLRTDSNPPWDLAGGSVASCTRRKFAAGTHTVTAVEADGDRHTAMFARP